MQPNLNVYALPQFVEPEEMAGGAAVVIDVLRSSTTIVHALAAGAAEVIPCLDISEALAMAEKYPADEVVLGGERDGLPIESFHLGNSPDEYAPERVGGKTVVFTSTNGTRAMIHARRAKEIFTAAFVNASATARRLLGRENVHILCAGTDGRISNDDVLMAGFLVERLQQEAGMQYRLNAQAMTAREYWLHTFSLPQTLGAEPIDPELLAEKLRATLGAQNLLALGFEDDIAAAAQLDRYDFATRLDPGAMRISAVEEKE